MPNPRIIRSLKGLRQIVKSGYQKAKERAAKRYKPITGTKKITRRQFFIRSAIGTAAIAGTYFGARKLRERIPFWLGAKKRYSLLMYFQDHIGGSFDPKEALFEIENARHRGEPYHIFFMEHAGSSKEDYTKIITSSEKNAGFLRIKYNELLKNGYKSEHAIELIIQDFINTGLDRRDAEFRANLAIEGIKIMPIELHEAKNLDQINRALISEKRKRTALTAMASMCKQLSEIQAQAAELLEEQNTINKIRDISFHDVEKRFDDAKKNFPELTKLPQIRAMGSLGTAHRTIYFSFNQTKSNVELREAKLPPDYHNYSLVAYAVIERPLVPHPTQRQTRILTLALYLEQKIKNLRKNMQKELSKKLFEKAINITQTEFEELNEKTKNIIEIKERTEFISNWLLLNN